MILKHLLYNVLILIIEILLLSHLKELFELDILYYFVEFIDLQSTISYWIVNLKVYPVLQEEKSQKEGYIFLLGL